MFVMRTRLCVTWCLSCLVTDWLLGCLTCLVTDLTKWGSRIWFLQTEACILANDYVAAASVNDRACPTLLHDWPAHVPLAYSQDKHWEQQTLQSWDVR